MLSALLLIVAILPVPALPPPLAYREQSIATAPVPVPLGRQHTEMIEHNGRWWVRQNGSWIVYHRGWLAYREGMFGGPPR